MIKGIINYIVSTAIILFLVLDSTIGLTTYSHFSSNLLPFWIALGVFIRCSIFTILLTTSFAIGMGDVEMSDKTNKLLKNSRFVNKFRMIFTGILYWSMSLLLAAHGFYWSSVFLLFWGVIVIINYLQVNYIYRSLKNLPVKPLNKKDEVSVQ